MITLLFISHLKETSDLLNIEIEYVVNFVALTATLDGAICRYVMKRLKKMLKFGRSSNDYIKEKKDARRELKRIKTQFLNNIGKDTLVAGRWEIFKKISNLLIPRNSFVDLNTGKAINRININKSFCLAGDAGIGKSTCLMNLYRQYNSKGWCVLNFFLSRMILYFRAEDLLKEKKEFVLSSIQKACYKRVFIICDGLDQLGDNEETLVENTRILKELKNMQYNGKLYIAVGCRTEYLKKYRTLRAFECIFDAQYSINKWTSHEISELIIEIRKEILKNNSHFSLESKQTVDLNVFDQLCVFNKEVVDIIRNNPLMCKMYCVVAASGLTCNIVELKNRYSLFLEFFKRILEREYQMYERKIEYDEDIEIALKVIAQYAHEQYQSSFFEYPNKKSIPWPNDFQKRISYFILDMEKGWFYHHTYHEFFVAYYYVEVLKKTNINIQQAVKVLSCLYNNMFADFISDGIKKYCRERELKVRLTEYLVYIYSFTVFEELKNSLIHLFLSQSKYVINAKEDLMCENTRAIESLSIEKFLYLKYEITFRLGRLQNKEVISFLKFVYYRDNLDCWKNHIFTDYERAILKRQCAVGASLLCEPEIEMSYVKKMLPEYNCYNLNYDLVNRSHTLIYYGDIVDTNILKYRDTGKASWELAKKKRISRLKTNIVQYSTTDKASCFRLFDLATLYTFLYSRKKGEQLTEEEIDIIMHANVSNILGMPKEREALMEYIKARIKELV